MRQLEQIQGVVTSTRGNVFTPKNLRPKVVYSDTVNKMPQDLTIREQEQVFDCQDRGLYWPKEDK